MSQCEFCAWYWKNPGDVHPGCNFDRGSWWEAPCEAEDVSDDPEVWEED